MQTQTLEHAAKWQVVRAHWVRRLLDGKQEDGQPNTPEKAEDYASWFTRCQALKEGFDMPSYVGKPECGYYAVLGINKIRWYTCCYQRDAKGTIVCYVNGELRHPDKYKLDWEKLWADAVKKPLEYPDYKHLKDTGRLPGESEAAAADRGNVVSISNGAASSAAHLPSPTLVPTARTDESFVTTTHNQPPEAVDDNSFDGVQARLEKLKLEGDFITVAKNENEAKCAYDLGDRSHKLEKAGTEGFNAEKAPYQQELDRVQAEVDRIKAKWKPVIDAAAAMKKRLKAVADQWRNAEKKRIKEENEKRIKAGEDPKSENVPIGNGLGRSGGQRTFFDPEIEDYNAFHAFAKDHQIIKDAHLELARHYAKSKIQPPPPGVKYHERTQTV
jgi:hypothetical protein